MVLDDVSNKGQIFVRGLTPSTNEKTLELAFSKFGPIEEIVVPKDRETRESKGFGFLTFVSPEDAADAIKGMDGKDVNGGTLTVQEATERRSSDRDKRGPPAFKSYDNDRGFGGRDFESRGYSDRGRGSFRGGRGSRGRDSDRGGRDFGSRGRGGGRGFSRDDRGRGFSRDSGFSRGRGGRDFSRDGGGGRGFSRDDDRGFSRDRGGGRGSTRGFSRDSGRGFSRDGGRGGSRGGSSFRGSRGNSPRGSFRDGASRFRDDSRGPRGPPRDMDSRGPPHDKYRDSFGSGGRDMGGYSNGSSFRDSFSSRDGPKDYGDRNDRYGGSRGATSYDSYPTTRSYDTSPPSRDYGQSRSSGYDSRDGGFGGSSGLRYDKSSPRDYGSSDRFGSSVMTSSRYDDPPSRAPTSRYDDPPPSRYDDAPRGPTSRYDDPPRGPPSSRDAVYDSYSTSGGRGFESGSRGPPPSRSLSSGPPGERGFGRGPPRDDRGPRSLSRDERGPRGPPRDDRGPPRGPPRDDRRERRMPRDMDDGPPMKRPRGDGPPMRGGRGGFRGGPRR